MLWQLQLHNLLHMLKRWAKKNRIEHDLYKRVKTTTSAKMLSDVDVVLQMQLFDSSHWWSIWLLRVIFLRSNGWATNFHPEAVDFFAAVGQRNNCQGDFERPVIWRKFICRSFIVAMLKVVKMKQYFDEHCQDLVKPAHVKHEKLFWRRSRSLWDWELFKLSWWHLITVEGKWIKSTFARVWHPQIFSKNPCTHDTEISFLLVVSPRNEAWFFCHNSTFLPRFKTGGCLIYVLDDIQTSAL